MAAAIKKILGIAPTKEKNGALFSTGNNVQETAVPLMRKLKEQYM